MSNFLKIQELQTELKGIPNYYIVERIKVTAKIAVLQHEDSVNSLNEVSKLANSIGYTFNKQTGEITKK